MTATNQPRYPDDRLTFDSDSQSAPTGERALTTALTYLRNFRQANPDYAGPVRLHLRLDFRPDTPTTTRGQTASDR